ncbi:Hypothetical predicted protein [Mytilus galloprovincialis]|uniref:Fork-head domain-containing protein n=1 Tax=Mytilus galloprovincialis TaxID=29158 RepID=A0A8B6CBW8_MYTGA|nr:Hypothetical predicted protein [Mytilus galloprovincialis]
MTSPVKKSNGDRTSTQSIHQLQEDDTFNSADKNQYYENDILSLNAKTSLEDSSQNSKPRYSYISMITKAVLSKKSRKIVLQDIYQYIMNTFPFYKNKEKAWRNSVRHNLSINECFIKIGRSGNGKGNFWSIHPSYIDDFIKGDFRLRQARRRTKHILVRGPTRYNSGYKPMTQLPTAFHQYLSNRPTMQDYYQFRQQESFSYGHKMNFSTPGERSKSENICLVGSDYEKVTKPFEYEQPCLELNSPFQQHETSTFGAFPHYCQYEHGVCYH